MLSNEPRRNTVKVTSAGSEVIAIWPPGVEVNLLTSSSLWWSTSQLCFRLARIFWEGRTMLEWSSDAFYNAFYTPLFQLLLQPSVPSNVFANGESRCHPPFAFQLLTRVKGGTGVLKKPMTLRWSLGRREQWFSGLFSLWLLYFVRYIK